MFVVVPPMLVQAGLALPEHWKLYLPVVLASFVFDGAGDPLCRPAQRREARAARRGRAAARSRGRCSAFVPRIGGRHRRCSCSRFFVAFNVLEALLPSLVSRLAPAQGRGAAIGVYNTTQTLGVFFGGVARRLGRRPPWRERRVRYLCRAGGRLARARRRHAPAAPRGQRGFESDVVDRIRGQSRGAERSARERARRAAKPRCSRTSALRASR